MTKTEYSSYGFSAWAVIVLFFIFWGQSGWYRVDCALGTRAACDLIAAEYVKKPTP